MICWLVLAAIADAVSIGMLLFVAYVHLVQIPRIRRGGYR